MENSIEMIRKQQGVTQEELAAALGVSRQTVGSLEKGRYNPSLQLAFRIARYFGRTVEELFFDQPDAPLPHSASSPSSAACSAALSFLTTITVEADEAGVICGRTACLSSSWIPTE